MWKWLKLIAKGLRTKLQCRVLPRFPAWPLGNTGAKQSRTASQYLCNLAVLRTTAHNGQQAPAHQTQTLATETDIEPSWTVCCFWLFIPTRKNLGYPGWSCGHWRFKEAAHVCILPLKRQWTGGRSSGRHEITSCSYLQAPSPPHGTSHVLMESHVLPRVLISFLLKSGCPTNCCSLQNSTIKLTLFILWVYLNLCNVNPGILKAPCTEFLCKIENLSVKTWKFSW